MDKVLIMHRLPAYRDGLVATFAEIGIEARQVERLGEAELRAASGCLLELRREHFLDVATLVRRHARVRFVGIVESPTCRTYREALVLGLHGIVAEDAGPRAFVQSVEHALVGEVALPVGVARSLAQEGEDRSVGCLSPEQWHWLHRLQAGEPVAALAAETGCSERQMYRRLRGLYGALDADGRSAALRQAAARGLLTVEGAAA